MNTDKPDEVERMAEKEEGEIVSPNKNGRPALIAVKVLAALAVVLLAYLLIRPIFKPHTYGVARSCQDNLRTIDGAIMTYEADRGEGAYPATPEDLVPNYIKYALECPQGGTYYLDTSQTPPVAVCSAGHSY